MAESTLELPEEFQPLAQRLSRWGPIWLVGGAVRDLYLGRRLQDLDLAVERGALATAREVAATLGGSYVLLDENRGCARVVLDRPGVDLDFADFRAEGLDADLRARDFTLNAMALRLDGDGTVVDPTEGLEDLKEGIVRLIDREALVDDPLRGLRGVRIAAELGFRLDVASRRTIAAEAPRLATTAAERRREELLRCLASPGPAEALRQLHDLGLLEHLLPELEQSSQPSGGGRDHFEHTLEVVGQVDRQLVAWEHPEHPDLGDHLRRRLASSRGSDPDRRVLLLLGAALHDVAKSLPPGASEDHARTGAAIAEERLRALRLGRSSIRRVATMVRYHTRPDPMRSDRPLGPRFLFRFLKKTRDVSSEVGMLMLADLAAKRPPDDPRLRRLRARVGELVAADLLERNRYQPPPLVTGDLLTERGICSPGPELGRLLDEVLEAQVVGTIRSPEEGVEWARRRLAEDEV